MEMCDGTVSAFIIPISQNRKEACGYELAYQGHKAQEGLRQRCEPAHPVGSLSTP